MSETLTVKQKLQAEIRRLEAENKQYREMLGKATKLSFEFGNAALSDIELMSPDQGKWYYAADATLFCEDAFSTALEAFTAALKQTGLE